jgi:hypothetical protein
MFGVQCVFWSILQWYIVLGYEFDIKEAERYVVLHVDKLGLANRLRTIADMHQIAVLSNRTLLLSWIPTIECNISFLELFEDGPSMFKVLPEHLPASGPQELVEKLATASGLSFARMTDQFDFFISSDMFLSDVSVVYTEYSGVVALQNMPCQYYLTKHSHFYEALVPVQTVRDIVAQILNIFENK